MDMKVVQLKSDFQKDKSIFLYLKEQTLIRSEHFGGIVYLLDKNIHYCVNKEFYKILRVIKNSNTLRETLIQLSNLWDLNQNEILMLINDAYNCLNFYSKKRVSNENVPKELETKIKLKGPIRIILEINSKKECNLNCKFCYEDTPYDKITGRKLLLEEIFKLIDDAKNLGVLYFQLMGGEPLVERDINKIMKRIIKHKMAVSFTTNGVLLGKYIKMLKRLNKSKLLLPIQVSLHGTSGKNYNKTTGNPSKVFGIVLKNIKELKKNNLRFGLKYVVTNENWNELPKLFKLASKHRAETLTLLHLLPIGGAKKEMKTIYFKTSIKRKVLHIIKDEKEKYPEMYVDYKPLLHMWYPEKPSTDRERFVDCPAGNIDLRIRADGKVIQCSSVRRVLFDLRKSSLNYVWKKFNEKKVDCPARCFGV